MALRDVDNYKFLKEALIQKFRRINDPNFQTFKGIPYGSIYNPQSIFGRTYNAFRQLITDKHLNLNQYLNIADKSVLERLYLNLKKDPNLKFLDNPDLVKDDPRYELTEEYHQKASAEQAAAQPAAETTPAMAGAPSQSAGGGMGRLPAPAAIGGGGGFGRRISVDEKGRVSSPVPSAKKTVETGLDYEGKPYEEAPATMASKKEVSEHKPATTTKPARTFQAPKMPAGISSSFKDSFSAVKRSFYRNIGSRISLNSMVNRMFNVIGGLGGSLGAMGGNPGIPSGGVVGSIKRRVLSGRNGLSFRTRFSKTPGLSKLKGFGTGKKVAVAFSLAGLLFGFSLFSAAFLPNQTTPTVSASNLLDYTIPFRNIAVVPQDIKSDVKASWPNAKLENWGPIIQKSVAAGWNPAFVLALWIEESGAQGVASYDDALGCSPGQPTTDIDVSLSCLFNNFSGFTNAQFAQFMLRYSEGFSGTTFITNPNFPNAIKFWYSRLVPAGPGALTFIPQSASYVLNGGSGIISCPVNSPTITLGSKDTLGGHCSADYQKSYPCVSPDITGRSAAIDLQSPDRTVFLPYLNGEKVTWIADESGTAINELEGGGYTFATTASSKGKTYRIRFVHINVPALKVGESAQSGTPISVYITTANHVHVTLQENGEFKPADLYFNLCK